jgi:hypothetical protein
MFTLANEGSTTEQDAYDAASSGRCNSAGPVLFLQLQRFAAAFERTWGRAPARVRTALLALAYNLELETTVLTHIDLPEFHPVTVGHVRLSTFVRSLGDLAVGQP